jgi:hypothetical protein
VEDFYVATVVVFLLFRYRCSLLFHSTLTTEELNSKFELNYIGYKPWRIQMNTGKYVVTDYLRVWTKKRMAVVIKVLSSRYVCAWVPEFAWVLQQPTLVQPWTCLNFAWTKLEPAWTLSLVYHVLATLASIVLLRFLGFVPFLSYFKILWHGGRKWDFLLKKIHLSPFLHAECQNTLSLKYWDESNSNSHL